MRLQEKKYELQSSILHLQDQITYKRRHIASLERLGRNELHIRLAMEYGSHSPSPAASRSTSLGSIASYSTASTGPTTSLCRGVTYCYSATDVRMDELRLELSTLQYLLAKRSKKLLELCRQEHHQQREQQQQPKRPQRYYPADDEINFVF
ncbi:hypothetical protein TRVA0_052S01156 [Trichomonascus vanleenenianus]|uniref:uncharacterized protein n=1 Tax=Trichomonascus vanleenenianus TaxID=2268995 RepID=UPI003ECAC7B6